MTPVNKHFLSLLLLLPTFIFGMRTSAQQAFDPNNGDALLFALGQAYNSEDIQTLMNSLEDSAAYSFDGTKAMHTFDIHSKGIGFDFNINFTLVSIRWYDNGFSKLKYPYSLPLGLFWKQSIDSVFFGNPMAQIDSSNQFKLNLPMEHLSGEVFFRDNELFMLRFKASADYILQKDEQNISYWGVRVMPNGVCVSGNCIQGTGTMKWETEGAVYEGSWYYGMPDGKGKLTLQSGVTYEGAFISGFFWGQGTLNYPGNFNYSGLFTMGQRNGIGYSRFADGSTYEGAWFNGVMAGKGIYRMGSRYTYEGNFENNQFHGTGILSTPEGIHKGSFKNNKPNGKGIMESRTGLKAEGVWIDGKKEGDFTLTDAQGKARVTRFKNDIEFRNKE